MWSVIERSVAKLTESEKSVIKEACPFGEIRFEGFDANQDSHFAIAQFLIKDLERFQEFKERHLNCHSSGSLNVYRGMLSVFTPLLRSLHGRPLTADEIVQILKGFEPK